MICPNDKTQMHQKDKIGGGEAEDNKYTTWELKECPTCGRLVKESYVAEVITPTQAEKLRGEQDIILEEVEE